MFTITNIDDKINKNDIQTKKYILYDLKNMTYSPSNNNILNHLLINKCFLMNKIIVIFNNNIPNDIIKYLLNTKIFKINEKGISFINNCLDNFILINKPKYVNYDVSYKLNYDFIIETFKKYYKNILITDLSYNNSILDDITCIKNKTFSSKIISENNITKIKELISTYNINKIIEIHHFTNQITEEENIHNISNFKKSTKVVKEKNIEIDNLDSNNYYFEENNETDKECYENEEEKIIDNISFSEEKWGEDINGEIKDDINNDLIDYKKVFFDKCMYLVNDLNVDIDYNLSNVLKDVKIFHLDFRCFNETYYDTIENNIRNIVNKLKY